MTTPVVERLEPNYGVPNPNRRSSDEDNTVVGEGSLNPSRNGEQGRFRSNSHLTIDTAQDPYGSNMEKMRSMQSPSQTREQAHRLDDDLAMLQVERQVSASNAPTKENNGVLAHSKSVARSRSRREEPVDEFDAATNPLHEKTAVYKPPENPSTSLAKFFKKVHASSFLVRYFVYITPLVLIILIPLLLGALLFKDSSVGGVQLVWFCIWLEIVWLTLWAGRILAKALPWPIGLISSLFTNNSKKWRDMGKQLELPATLFFWWLAIEISFLPTMTNHHLDHSKNTKDWEKTMNKVLISIFVAAILNFVEKIIIQLIAISFHLRTYQDRIELNKFQIGSLVKLYEFSKQKIQEEDSDFEAPSGPGSGARTPGQMLHEGQQTVVKGFRKFGDVAGKIAGDFTGHQVKGSHHPQQVILALLHTTGGSQVLARRLYRTFYRPEDELVHSDDLQNAFENQEEADAAFSMFDKDMNGDISMEELESVCVEIGRERKSITASLKDLDSVVGKLDDVFMFIVFVITVLVFISLISTSAAGVLTSAGSTVLALSWLFSATAQEFLQSVIFVFVKHPFDVGDRVSIYGNTGSQLKGDDYFVKEISLLYTEFKKMEGHVVQAPNSYLNTLFILNQRRSGGLAEAVPVVIKFGTTLDQIDQLRQRLLEFVRAEKREYQSNILTELRDVTEAHSLTLNVVFFYKSNWQNELLRLQRRNKFICAMMVSMQELGIEGPRMRYPGQKESFPVYLQNVPHMATPGAGHGGTPDNPAGRSEDPPFVAPAPEGYDPAAEGPSVEGPLATDIGREGSQYRPPSQSSRQRGESIAAMGRRVDFSLGMKDVAASDFTGDVYEDRDRSKNRIPVRITSPSRPRASQDTQGSRKRSKDVARSTSVDGPEHPGIHRIATDMTTGRSHSSHRNRFFGRHRGATINDEEQAMADIPEQPSGSAGSPAGGLPGQQQRLDPRSGIVTSKAMHSSEDIRGRAASQSAYPGPDPVPGPRRATTENFEMRRM